MADASAFRTDFFSPTPAPNALFDTANKVIGNQLLATQAKQAEQSRLLEQMGVLQNAMASIANKENPSRADFEALNSYVEQGVIDPAFFSTEMKNIPAQGSPEDYRSIANTYWNRLASATEKYGAQFGYSPGSAATLQSYTGPRGEPRVNTTGNIANEFGIGGPVQLPMPPAAEGAPGSSVPSPFEAGGVPAAPSGSGVAGPAPQDQAMFEASAGQYQRALERSANWPAIKQPYEELLTILPEAMSGKGTKALNDAAKVLSSLGIPVPEEVNTQAELASLIEKYSAQLATSLPFAGKSDAQLNAAFSVTPGTEMDRDAAIGITKKLFTLSRMEQGLAAWAEQNGVAPEDFTEVAQKWGSEMDARAFGFDLMSDEERAKLKKSLETDKGAREKFMQSYKIANGLGLLGG